VSGGSAACSSASQQLRGGEAAATGQFEWRRRRLRAHRRELAVELADRAGQGAAAGKQVACDPHLHLGRAVGEPAADPAEPDGPVERASRLGGWKTPR
jgi:hypothetical protein